MTGLDFQLSLDLAPHFEAWTTDAIVSFALLGSFARGDSGHVNDLDAVHFVNDHRHADDSPGYLIERIADGNAPNAVGIGKNAYCLAVRKTTAPGRIESWLIELQQAV